MPPKKKFSSYKAVETLKHDEARRKNIPSAEHQSVMQDEESRPARVGDYGRKSTDEFIWEE